MAGNHDDKKRFVLFALAEQQWPSGSNVLQLPKNKHYKSRVDDRTIEQMEADNAIRVVFVRNSLFWHCEYETGAARATYKSSQNKMKAMLPNI